MDPRYNQSGIEPWSPPPGFENPVPDDDYGGVKGLFFVIVLVALIIGGIYAYNNADDWYDDAREKIEQEIDKIQFPGEDATDQAQQKSDNTGGDQNTLEVDGKSSLPGGFARTVYEPQSQMSEFAARQDIDNEYDGSNWFLTRPTSDGNSTMQLGYYTFIPPIATEAEREAYWDSTEQSLAGQYGTSDLDTDDVKVDGINGRVWRFESPNKPGEQHVFAWFLGPTNSYSYLCTSAPGDDTMAEQCEDSLDALKLKS